MYLFSLLISQEQFSYFADKSRKCRSSVWWQCNMVFFIQSHLNDGLKLRGYTPAANRHFLLQKNAVRILTLRCRMEPCRSLLVDLGIMIQYQQYVFNSVAYSISRRVYSTKLQGVMSMAARLETERYTVQSRLSKTTIYFPNAAVKLFSSLDEETRGFPTNQFMSGVSRLWRQGLSTPSKNFMRTQSQRLDPLIHHQ